MDKPLIYRASNTNEALRQGEILAGVIRYKPIPDESTDGSFVINSFQPIIYPYTIIVSQDCDLDWDYQARKSGKSRSKILHSVLLCEVSIAQAVMDRDSISSNHWMNFVKNNFHLRYHFFEKVPSECASNQEELPELTVDFKKIFSVDVEFLYYLIGKNEVIRLAVMESPYLEHFSQRYHAFHSRVALPEPHQSV